MDFSYDNMYTMLRNYQKFFNFEDDLMNQISSGKLRFDKNLSEGDVLVLYMTNTFYAERHKSDGPVEFTLEEMADRIAHDFGETTWLHERPFYHVEAPHD